MNGIYLSRAQRDFLNWERARAQQRQRTFEQQATPIAAANTASFHSLYPTASMELGLSLTASGIPASDPQVAEIVALEQTQRAVEGPLETPGGGVWDSLSRGLSEFVMDPVKGATRWSMMGLMSVYESTVGGTGPRAIQQAATTDRELTGPNSTLYEQQPFYTKGLADVFRDPITTMQSVWQESTTRDSEQQAMLEGGQMQQTSNFGSGWFPSSTVAPDVQEQVNQATVALHRSLDSQNLTPNQRYKAELEASPEIWSAAVAGDAYQAGLGAPTTQQGYANREAVMFSVPSLAGRGSKLYTPYSPGRIAAATILEPGTQNFAIASGITDIGAQVFADPMNLIGGYWAKSGVKGRTIKAGANEIIDNIHRALRSVVDFPAGKKVVTDVAEVGDEAAGAAARFVESATPQEAYAAYLRGELPYVPDASIDMMDNLKITVGSTNDMTEWSGKAPGALSPLDPPEAFVRDFHAQKRGGSLDPRINGKTRKEFERSYEDFYLPEGTADEFASADATNRLGQDPSIHMVTNKKAGNTNQKVRVFGDTLDLRKPGKPQDLPPRIRKVMVEEKMWYKEDGFIRNMDPITGNPSQRFIRALRESGIGKVELPDGRTMILDDFIGGTKTDHLGSRLFFDDGQAPIFASDSARAANVTPNQINGKIDQMKALAKHAINEDGTIDLSKLTPEAMIKLVDENPELVKELEAAALRSRTPDQLAIGNRPGLDPTKPYELSGKHADNLVDDLFEMAKDPKLGPGRIDRFMSKMERKGVPVTREIREAILQAAQTEGKTAEDIRAILAAWIGQGPSMITLPGGARYGRMRGALGVIDDIVGSQMVTRAANGSGPMGKIRDVPWVQRQMATMMPSKGLNLLDDPDTGYSQLVAWLDNYGMKRGDPEMEAILSRLRNMAPGDRADGYKIIEDYSERLFTHLNETTDGRIGDAFIKEATTFIEEVGGKHIYNAERVGQTDLGDIVGGAVRVNGEVLHTGAMNLTSEMWNGALHVPDPVTMKRVAGYQTRFGQVANFIVSKKVYQTGDDEWVKASKLASELRDQDEQLARRLLDQSEKGVIKAETKAAKLKSEEALTKANKAVSQAKKTMATREKNVKVAAKKAGKKQAIKDKAKTSEQILDDINTNPQRVEIHDRAGYLVARSVMNKIWKPLVLLRGAWLLRILMDDQMRVAADGMSMFNHPLRTISYAMQQPKAFREAFQKGFVDVNGVRVTIDNIEEVQHGLYYQKAAMAIPDGTHGKGAHGSRFSKMLGRNDPLYEEGLTARLSQFGADPLGRRLAAGDGSEEVIKEAVGWLRGEVPDDYIMGVGGNKALQDLMALKASDPGLARSLESKDPEAIQKIVEDINAQMHRASGGVVALDNGQGRWKDYADPRIDITDQIGRPPPHRYQSTEAVPVVIKKGDAEILAVLADGKGGLNKAVISSYDNTLKNAGHKEFRSMVNKKLRDNTDNTVFPSQVYGPDYTKGTGKRSFQEVADDAVSTFYTYLMTKPSDRLSRSPLFAARYWRSMGERLPFLDEDVAAMVLKRADAAGKRKQVEWAAEQTKNFLGSDIGKVGGTLGAKSGIGKAAALDNLDEYAKAAGLAEVESVLFNLTNRRNVSDSLSLIFPFVEAWGEFATRWSRLMVYGDRNIKNMNRFQQSINGLRESDPFNPTGNQGFFHQNDFGQEVFSYPAGLTKAMIGVHNMLAKVSPMTEISPEVADSVKATGTVESLNFAAGVIPGFGPVFQVASKAVLSDDPRWDGIKRMIAPFGTSGGLAAQFAPAWLKRFLSAMGSEDPQLNAMYLSTVQDVVRTKINNGEWDHATSKQDFDFLITEAENEAKNLLIVRGVATWGLPVSPSYQFMAEDDTGKVHTYQVLGTEYRKILYDEAGGDETTAFDIFHERFGFLPAGFTQSKTYTIKPGPVTTEGYAFERANPGYFDAYPNTAMFLMPSYGQETNEFNYERYLEKLRTSEREQWTGEQMAALNDSMLGNMEWDHSMLSIQYLKDGEDHEAHRTESAKIAEDIQLRHPYWRQGIPGKRAGAPIEDKRAEIEAWTRNPDLRNVPAVKGVTEYLKMRQFYLDGLTREFGVTTLEGSEKEYGIRARSELRAIAASIMSRFPEFESVFNSVYSLEISTNHDGYSDERVAFYNDDTDLFEETLGISPSTLPQFTNQYLGGAT